MRAYCIQDVRIVLIARAIVHFSSLRAGEMATHTGGVTFAQAGHEVACFRPGVIRFAV